MSIDTGVAKLPALPTVRVEDPSLQRWMQAVAERLEVREGQRGNDKERAVTVRDLEKALKGLSVTDTETSVDSNGDLKIKVGGMTATVSVQQFADAIRRTRLYRDLMKRLDDPTRFNDLPSEIRDVLLRSIAEEAALRGADIRRLETKIQDANRSLAMVTEEITASLGNNAAGIREVQAAYVNSTQATAVKVTQLESSLGNYYQDGNPGRVALEEQLTTQASFVDGLRGQYTLKIQAGGALAGFGLAASEIDGNPSSAFLISADKFAVVAPDYSGGLTTSPPMTNIPFGVDSGGVYINGQVRINATGLQLDQLSKAVSLTAPTNVFKQAANGSWSGDTIVITANKLGGLTGTPSWSIVSGTYGGSLPAGNSLTVARASMGSDVVVFRATASDGSFSYSDDFTIARLVDGSNAITVVVSNEAHALSADAAGNVPGYTGSGTEIRVFEGAAALLYDGLGTSNGRWTVTASGTNITPGPITDSGDYATVGNHANFLTAQDLASITYTITGMTAGGTSFSITKTQSFSKSKTGAAGANGATGAAGPRGSQTFYATGSVWSDTTANNIITTVTGSATKIIGDTVTISNGSTFAETKYWSGVGWVAPGVVIDGNLLVNGTISGQKIAANTVTADKIDSRNLTIKDASGNIIFGSGTNLDWSRITSQPSGIYNSNISIGANGALSGAGGGQVSLTGLGAGDFAFIDQLTTSNIGTYIQSAAIGTALIANAAITSAKIGTAAIETAKIGDLAVNTIKIAGNAVTVTGSVASRNYNSSVSLSTTSGGVLSVIVWVEGGYASNGVSVKLNGSELIYFEGNDYFNGATQTNYKSSQTMVIVVSVGSGTQTVSFVNSGSPSNNGPVIRAVALLTQR